MANLLCGRIMPAPKAYDKICRAWRRFMLIPCPPEVLRERTYHICKKGIVEAFMRLCRAASLRSSGASTSFGTRRFATDFMQLGGALQHLWILPRRLGLRRREEAGSIRKSSSSHVPGAKPGTTNPALSVNDI